MIGRIQGILIERQPPQIVLMAAGVGYEVDVPMSTFYDLPALQEEVTLYTQLLIREDAHLLYGFATLSERGIFRKLIKVAGIGAKSALAILSGMSVDEFALAIRTDNVASLCKIPGIGAKTAERLVLELRGKLIQETAYSMKDFPLLKTDHRLDILQALMALGYSEKEGARVIKQLEPEVSVNEGIRFALQLLSKV